MRTSRNSAPTRMVSSSGVGADISHHGGVAGTEVHRDLEDAPVGWVIQPRLGVLLMRLADASTAFLINLRSALVPGDTPDLGSDGPSHHPEPASKPGPAGSRLYLLPDRVLHPRYAPAKRGKGFWVTCHRDVLQTLSSPGMSRRPIPLTTGPHLKMLSRTSGLVVPDQLPGMVEEQLRSRVIQEIELLRDRLRAMTPRASRREESVWEGPVLSRLRREEAHDRQTVALLDLSRNVEPGIPPVVGIPRYHLNTLFTAQSPWRALASVLAVERTDLYRANRADRRSDPQVSREPSREKDKASSVLALRTWESEKGVLGVPLAVALWRLRCWSGEGWVQEEGLARR
jgi:hypothetical protein